MAKKKLAAIVKIQIPAGQATPAPPVGTALGPPGETKEGTCQLTEGREAIGTGQHLVECRVAQVLGAQCRRRSQCRPTSRVGLDLVEIHHAFQVGV